MMYATVWEAAEEFPGSMEGTVSKTFKHMEGWDAERVMFYLSKWADRIEGELDHLIDCNETAWGGGWWDKRTVSVYQIGTRDIEYKIKIDWKMTPPDNVFDDFYQLNEKDFEEEWEEELLEEEKQVFE